VTSGAASARRQAGEDATYISRIREDVTVENGLSLWCVSDNLRKSRVPGQSPAHLGEEEGGVAGSLVPGDRSKALLGAERMETRNPAKESRSAIW
jgi:Semialdehyde dehydrogenase, dimerisation domain